MRLADAIWARLSREVTTVFYLPGGGACHLVDALGQSGLQAVACLHEAGAGYAALAYGQIRGLGVCLVTSGPGASNAITPCLAAWVDSAPVLFISGQVVRSLLASPGIRSRGPQEAPTIEMVKPITKCAYLKTTASDALYDLDELITLAKAGRPGPVWMDLCMDLQAEECDV